MVRVWLRMVSLVGVVVTKVMRAAVGVRRFQVKSPSVLGVILALPVMVVRVGAAERPHPSNVDSVGGLRQATRGRGHVKTERLSDPRPAACYEGRSSGEECPIWA